jgi:hypothetical protein
MSGRKVYNDDERDACPVASTVRAIAPYKVLTRLLSFLVCSFRSGSGGVVGSRNNFNLGDAGSLLERGARAWEDLVVVFEARAWHGHGHGWGAFLRCGMFHRVGSLPSGF